MSGKLKDHFKDGQFQEYIETASAKANTEWEGRFCDDLVEKFEQWGDGMYISLKQVAILENIMRRGER